MPQKKNYDLFEIMRGNGRVFSGYQMQIQVLNLSLCYLLKEIILGLGCGYHRDLQLTKKPFVQGVNLVKETVQLLITILPELMVNEEALQSSMSPHLFATDEVYKLVATGVPFRQAYQEVKERFFASK